MGSPSSVRSATLKSKKTDSPSYPSVDLSGRQFLTADSPTDRAQPPRRTKLAFVDLLLDEFRAEKNVHLSWYLRRY